MDFESVFIGFFAGFALCALTIDTLMYFKEFSDRKKERNQKKMIDELLKTDKEVKH